MTRSTSASRRPAERPRRRPPTRPRPPRSRPRPPPPGSADARGDPCHLGWVHAAGDHGRSDHRYRRHVRRHPARRRLRAAEPRCEAVVVRTTSAASSGAFIHPALVVRVIPGQPMLMSARAGPDGSSSSGSGRRCCVARPRGSARAGSGATSGQPCGTGAPGPDRDRSSSRTRGMT